MLLFKDNHFVFNGSGLQDGVMSFIFSDSHFESDKLAWTENDDIRTAMLPNGLLISMQIDGEVLFINFKNTGSSLFLKKIELNFPASLKTEDYLEYTHSRLFLEQASGVKPVGTATSIFEHNPPSYMLYMLSPRQSGNSLLFAALPPNQGEFMVFQAVHESTSMRGHFGLKITAEEERSIAPGAEFALSRLLFQSSDKDPVLLLEELGERYEVFRKMELKDVQLGWNSWDEFHCDVKPEDVYRIQKELKDFSGGKISTFVVDDGWQTAYGAWTPNPKFPQDLNEFCRKVSAEGGTAGIWTAPLCLANGYMVPKEWVATTPIPDRRWILDITHPGAQEHIRKIYSGLYKAGFRYFKVDFTNCILEAEKLYDMSYGKAGVLRKLYQIIRDSIGQDSYFLGCCVPFEPAFGIVDAVRTTADIQIFWSCVEINMTSASARWWMHRRLWNNDSDFLVVRGPETSDQRFPQGCPFVSGKYGSGPRLSQREAMSLALAIYMTNGDIMFSDNFSALNESGRKILKDMLALDPLKQAARPVDLFSSPCGELPSFWWDAESGKLAVFNWSEDFRTIAIKLGQFNMKHIAGSFWNPLEAKQDENGSILLELKPHESTGLVLA